MLETQHVASYYRNSPVLQDVSIKVGAGGFLAVLGRNGVGKTTLLKTVMGLTDRVTGRLLFDGRDITNTPTYERARLGIGYVPQGRGIIPRFTVRENILMGSFARSDGKREIPEFALELFPMLREFLNRLGGVLSGGQQQQLAVARALSAKPRLILLDEPTEGIQPNHRRVDRAGDRPHQPRVWPDHHCGRAERQFRAPRRAEFRDYGKGRDRGGRPGYGPLR